MYKELFSAVAIGLTLVAFLPYIISILAGKTNPHVFSWVIWGITTVIVFGAQLSDHGGVGAWPTGVSGAITFLVAFLAYRKRDDITITFADWGFFLLALLSLPFWYVTSNPLWAVVILTTVDLMGFIPTFRKAFFYPFEESLWFFAIMAVRNAFATLALEHYSLTTILFPVAIGVACIVFIIMVLARRVIVNIKH